MNGRATYLYAITRPMPADEIPDVRGVAGAPVRLIRDGELACLVSTVELGEFGEQALSVNLEDLHWLERTARQHDAVVQASARVSTTLPMRLATICRDDRSARERLQQLGSAALATLAALDGREEWGVKLFVSPGASDARPPAAGATSGAAYLRRRREDLTQREHASERAVRDAEAVYDRLTTYSVDARRHRPQDQRLTGATQPMVLNAAFLVERARSDEFQDAANELASRHEPGAVVLTGPWPPYSFATVADE
jgi:hypothetical protein